MATIDETNFYEWGFSHLGHAGQFAGACMQVSENRFEAGDLAHAAMWQDRAEAILDYAWRKVGED